MDHIEPTTTTFKTGIKYGNFLGLATVAVIIFLYYSGMQDFEAPDNLWFPSLISIAVMIAITVLGIREFKYKNEGVLYLGDAVITAVYIGLIGGLLGGVLTLIFYQFAEDDLYAKMISFMMDFTVNNSDKELGQEQIDVTQMIFNYTFTPFGIFISNFLNSVMMTAIIGLIAGLIMKTD